MRRTRVSEESHAFGRASLLLLDPSPRDLSLMTKRIIEFQKDHSANRASDQIVLSGFLSAAFDSWLDPRHPQALGRPTYVEPDLIALLKQIDTWGAAAEERSINTDERKLETNFAAGAGTDHPAASNTVEKDNETRVETIRKKLVIVGLPVVLRRWLTLAGCRVMRLRRYLGIATNTIRPALNHAG